MRRRPFVGVLFCAVVGCLFLSARQKTAEVATQGVETKVRGHGLNPLEASVKEQLEKIRGIERRLDSIEEVARRGGRTRDGVLAPTTVAPVPHRPSARALPVVPPNGDNITSPITADAHVFYYPWYGTPEVDGKWMHWNHVRIPHWNKQTAAKYRQDAHVPPDDIGSTYYPALGPYSSADDNVVRHHFQAIAAAGIGTACISWYGRSRHDGAGDPLDPRMPSILDAAAAAGVKISWHLEPYESGRGKGTADEIKKDIAYINAKYRHHPACLKDASGLAVFFVYDSYRTPAAEWATLFTKGGRNTVRGNAKRGNGADGVFISLVVEKKHLDECVAGGFDGFYTYFAVDKFSWGSTWRNFKPQQSFADRHGLQFYPSVGPGYDDTRVRPWNNANTRARDGGSYYTKAFAALYAANPTKVTITSWNEWHEGTQIEEAKPKAGYPSYSPGGQDFYLKETRKHLLEWVQRLKG